MLKTGNFDRLEQFSEEEGFRQLDLLYKIYKLDNQREMLIKKLHKLQKTIKNNLDENFSMKLGALKTVSEKFVQKKKIILSQIKDSYNFFELSNQIKKLKQYILQLNKTIKRKEIDANTHRITRDYYENQLKCHIDNLNKLKMVAKEYIIILKNQEIQLKTEERFRNYHNHKKIYHIISKINTKRENIPEKIELKKIIEFLTKQIIEYRLY